MLIRQIVDSLITIRQTHSQGYLVSECLYVRHRFFLFVWCFIALWKTYLQFTNLMWRSDVRRLRLMILIQWDAIWSACEGIVLNVGWVKFAESNHRFEIQSRVRTFTVAHNVKMWGILWGRPGGYRIAFWSVCSIVNLCMCK